MSVWAVGASELVALLAARVERPVNALDAMLHILGGTSDEDGTVVEGALRPVLEALAFPERAIPKAFHYAGEDLGPYDDAAYWPKCLVGGTFPLEEFGHDWKLEATLAVTIAWPPAVGRREQQESFDVASVVSGILRHPNYQGFYNPDTGAVAWGHLMPTGYRPVPMDWQKYSGWMATFILRQFSGGNQWS